MDLRFRPAQAQGFNRKTVKNGESSVRLQRCPEKGRSKI